MTTDELAYSTVAEVAPKLASGEVSPVELTWACLDRISRLDKAINAFITVLPDAALEEARQTEREIRERQYRGPLTVSRSHTRI